MNANDIGRLCDVQKQLDVIRCRDIFVFFFLDKMSLSSLEIALIESNRISSYPVLL